MKYSGRGDNKSPAFEFHWNLGTNTIPAPDSLQTYAVIFHDVENSTAKTTADTPYPGRPLIFQAAPKAWQKVWLRAIYRTVHATAPASQHGAERRPSSDRAPDPAPSITTYSSSTLWIPKWISRPIRLAKIY